MAKYKFEARLTKESIDNLIAQINTYQNTFHYKVLLLNQKLAEYGMQIAKSKLGILDDVGNTVWLVGFQITTQTSDGKTITILRAYDTNKVISTWVTKNGLQQAEISPLLMAEFGSGWNSQNPLGIAGVGQGTYPGQTHALDKPGWNWQDADGKWHFSEGVTPQMPMYSACIEMENNFKRIAREVFG